MSKPKRSGKTVPTRRIDWDEEVEEEEMNVDAAVEVNKKKSKGKGAGKGDRVATGLSDAAKKVRFFFNWYNNDKYILPIEHVTFFEYLFLLRFYVNFDTLWIWEYSKYREMRILWFCMLST